MIKSSFGEFIDHAPQTFYADNHPIHLIEKGESAALALSLMTKEPNLIAIDERTTRMLSEKPENLERIMAEKLHQRVLVNKENL